MGTVTQSARKGVLIVDDDPITSRLLLGLFDHHGIGPVTAVRTLAEAGRAINTTAFDALIADLHLPDGNGMELVHLARRGPRSKVRSAVIAVSSAYASARTTRLLRRLGADAVLGKPVDPAALVGLVAGTEQAA